MRDLNLKATEYFEAVARLGSVTKAASELGVSPSAVSQQLRLLETQFGVKLFRREKQRLVLTLDGDRLFQTTTLAFKAIRNARSAIAHQRGRRSLNLRVSPSFGVRWLGPRIAAFLVDNSDWNIRIDATPDFTSFETETFDFDLRYGLGGWVGLSERCVMHDFVLPLCSPEYLKHLQLLDPDPIAQLRHARLIDSAKMLFRWDIWLASNGMEIEDLDYPLRFDRSSMSIEFGKQGAGMVLDSVTLCLPELQSGQLVPLSTAWPVLEFPAYWLVCPSRHLNRRIVRRFIEWIGPECEAHQSAARSLLSGLGCSFRCESGSSLLQMEPLSLS